MNETYPCVLPPLPYINKEALHIHRNTLFQGYVTRLNAALKTYPEFRD